MAVNGRCPGEGFCERITDIGEDDWTLEEKFEEAMPGCPRRCSLPPKSKETTTENEFSEDECESLAMEIEEMVDAFRAGERLDLDESELWQREAFVYWLKIERGFERNVQLDLRGMIKAFLYKEQ